MEKLYKYLIIINIISFFIYYIDKKNAIKKRIRVPEGVLLLLSFLGGALGSILSMYIFHHKTRKWYFVLFNFLFLISYTYILVKGV